MILSVAQRFANGAFADLFRLDENTVLKLFRRQNVTHEPVADPTVNEIVLRAVWDAERRAHEQLRANEELGRFSVPYRGRPSVEDVIDAKGVSIADLYLLDCALTFAYVPGKDRKVPHLQGHELFPAIDSYLDELRDAGIRHPYDSSVFIPGLGTQFTVIDVATWDAMAELTEPLVFGRSLTESARSKWGSPLP